MVSSSNVTLAGFRNEPAVTYVAIESNLKLPFNQPPELLKEENSLKNAQSLSVSQGAFEIK